MSAILEAFETPERAKQDAAATGKTDDASPDAAMVAGHHAADRPADGEEDEWHEAPGSQHRTPLLPTIQVVLTQCFRRRSIVRKQCHLQMRTPPARPAALWWRNRVANDTCAVPPSAVTERAMSTEPQSHDRSHFAEPELPEIVPEGADRLMQAATARISALEAEVNELRDRWIRSEAEISNVRARAKRDVEETRQYAVQKFARDVVEAADNLRRGLDSLPPPREGEQEIVARLRDGFQGVERSFLALLERNGIKKEDPTGTPFDPNLHQAMSEQESADHPPGTVTQAWTGAWTLNGRLLRPAMVVVSKAPAGRAAAPEANSAVDRTA